MDWHRPWSRNNATPGRPMCAGRSWDVARSNERVFVSPRTASRKILTAYGWTLSRTRRCAQPEATATDRLARYRVVDPRALYGKCASSVYVFSIKKGSWITHPQVTPFGTPSDGFAPHPTTVHRTQSPHWPWVFQSGYPPPQPCLERPFPRLRARRQRASHLATVSGRR